MNAIAVLESEFINGTVTFHQCPKHQQCIVSIDMKGPKNSVHAIHIHEFGDLRKGCESLGPHWNPHNETHGSILVANRPRHAGDLCSNMVFDKDGIFSFQYKDPLVKVDEIYGRSVVVHYGRDDLGLGGDEESLKTGNAGKRLACGIIGRVK